MDRTSSPNELTSPNDLQKKSKRWITTPGYPLSVTKTNKQNSAEHKSEDSPVTRKPRVPRLSSSQVTSVLFGPRNSLRKSYSKSHSSTKGSIILPEEQKETVKEQVQEQRKSLSSEILKQEIVKKVKVKSNLAGTEITKRRQSGSPKLVLEPIPEQKQAKVLTKKPPKIKTLNRKEALPTNTNKFAKSQSLQTVKRSRSIKELVQKYTANPANDSELKVAEFLKRSPYNQSVQPLRTAKNFYPQIDPQINQSADSPLQQSVIKRHSYQMDDANQRITLSKLRVMEFLENSSSGNNVFKTLKQARSQGGFASGTSISRLTSVNNNSQYQKLIRIQTLENDLEQKRIYPKKLIVPPLAFKQFASRNAWDHFDNTPTELPPQHSTDHLSIPNQVATTDRRNSFNAQETVGSKSNETAPKPQNIIVVKRKTKPFRPFDITSNQSTNRQFQSEHSESFSETFNSQRDQHPAMEVVAVEYDPILIPPFQPSRTFVSQGVRSLILDATPEQDSQQEADQDAKDSIVTEEFIQEDKASSNFNSPAEKAFFNDEVIGPSRNRTISMRQIQENLQEYLIDKADFQQQPFQLVVENEEYVFDNENRSMPEVMPLLNLKSIDNFEQDENEYGNKSNSLVEGSEDSLNKFSQQFRVQNDQAPEVAEPPNTVVVEEVLFKPIKIQVEGSRNGFEKATTRDCYSPTNKRKPTMENKRSASKQSSKPKNPDLEAIALELDLSQDFDALPTDQPKQFKRLTSRYASTKGVSDYHEIEKLTVQKQIMKRTSLKEFRALENQKEMEIKRVQDSQDVKSNPVESKPIGEITCYNYYNLVQQTVDPDASDNESEVALTTYHEDKGESNFTQIGNFVVSNLLAMAVLKRIKIRINSIGDLCVEELKSSQHARYPVDHGEGSPSGGRQRKDSNDTSHFTAHDEKSSLTKTFFTFKEKKTTEAHLDNVINALINGNGNVKGKKEKSRDNLDEYSDSSQDQNEHKNKMVTKIITAKQLWEVDELLTNNTYLRAKKTNKVQNIMVQGFGNGLNQENKLNNKFLALFRNQTQKLGNKADDSESPKKVQDIESAKSQQEMWSYLNDKFPIPQTHQSELKNLSRVTKMQQAVIDISDDIVAQMAKVKPGASIIKREVFQSRSNSNNVSSGTVTSLFKRPKKKKIGLANLNEIREDASQLSDDYDQSSVMVIQDWNQQLKKCDKWFQMNQPQALYLRPFSCDVFLLSQHFQVEPTLSQQPDRHSHFGFSDKYIQYIRQLMQNKVFQKNFNYVLKLAIAKRTKYLDSIEKTSAQFEVNMNSLLLSMIVKQTKQQNVIFKRNGVVKFLSSIFAQDETLVLNCLHNVNSYPKQMIQSLQDIFKRQTNDEQQLGKIYYIKKNLDSLTPEMFRSRASEFTTTKQLVINNELFFINEKKVKEIETMALPTLEANLQIAQECGNLQLVRAITSKIQSHQDQKQAEPDQTFSTQADQQIFRFINTKKDDGEKGSQLAQKIITQILTKNYKRRSTLQVLNSIPKYVRYQKLSQFLLCEDFGFITQIQSQGNFMVFTPVLAKTFFEQRQTDPSPATKKSDKASKYGQSPQHSFGIKKIGSKEFDSPSKGANEPSPIKEALCEDEEDFGSDSSFGRGKQKELIASIAMLQNKLDDTKSEDNGALTLGTIDTRMKEKNRLKELKKKFILRASTAVTDSYKSSGVNLKLIRKSLDYEAISEKTGEGSEFILREEQDLISSEIQLSKNRQSVNKILEQQSSNDPVDIPTVINIPIKDLRTDDDSGEEVFEVDEVSQTNTSDISNELESSYEVTHEDSDQTPKLAANMRQKSSKFDTMTANAIQNFLSRANTIKPYQANKRETQEISAETQVHRTEYRDFSSYQFVTEMAEIHHCNPKNVIRIVRPKGFVPKKQEKFYWQSQAFGTGENRNNFFKSKPIMPQYQTQQNLKTPDPEIKAGDKNKVVQYFIAKNINQPSLVKAKAESALIVSLNQVKTDKDRRNHLKVLRAIETNNFKQVQHFIRSNHQGVDIVDKFENTLLNFAAQYGCLEICELLINSGFKINTRNIYGNTPLHYAIAFNHQQLADLFIQNGAEEDLKNNKKMTPWQGI